MIPKQLIRLALRNAWKSLTEGGTPVIPIARIAWENEKFTPPTNPNDFFIREFFHTVNERLSGSDLLEFDGIYELAIFVAPLSGTKTHATISKAIGDLLKPGTSLTDPFVVYILRASTGTVYDDEGWKVLPVRFIVKSYGTR